MKQAVIWTKDNCTYCTQAKLLMDAKGINYEERHIGSEWTKEQLLEAVPSARSVPQIFLNNEYIGGFTDLQKALA